jgi:hypothetical protein
MNQEKAETDQITDQITSKPGEDVLEPRSESGAGAQPSSSGRRRFFRQVGAASLGITASMTGMQRLVSAASEHAFCLHSTNAIGDRRCMPPQLPHHTDYAVAEADTLTVWTSVENHSCEFFTNSM